jgi:hypothetical protein
MTQFKVTGQVKNDGTWNDIAVTVVASNEKIARVKATGFMHKIDKVEKVA